MIQIVGWIKSQGPKRPVSSVLIELEKVKGDSKPKEDDW